MAFSTTQITGSPFTAPHSGIDTLCHVNDGGNKRLYYSQGLDFTKIFCMTLTGTADSTREITVSSMNSANTTTMEGLCSDGSFIYALVGAEGSQAIHKYRLSDRSLVAHLDVPVRQTLVGIETYVLGHTRYILVLGQQQVNGWDDSLNRQTVADFVLAGATGVGSGDWLGLTYDTETRSLLALGEVTPSGGGTPTEGIFGFSIAGARKESEDVNFGTISFKGMTFNGDDDRLYLMHGSSNQLYGYGETVRWDISSANLNVTQGTNYTLDLNIYVTDNATITVAPGTDLGNVRGALLSGGVFTWTNPPAPAGGASNQVVPLTFRATLGAGYVDQTFNFQLHGTVVVTTPAWVGTGIPAQTVFEPYNPPPGAPFPNISHGFIINLSDYLRVGTPPISFTASDGSGNTPGRFSINTRFVNDRAVRDSLTYNAGAANDLVQADIQVRAQNSRGHDTTDISVTVHNLIYPAWHGSQDINISDTASHSVNLRNLLTADPQASIDLVGTAPASLNLHLNNAILTLRADELPLGAAATHQVTFTATNILTTQAGVSRRFNINVAKRVLPPAPPVWLDDDIMLTTNRGQSNRVDLHQYIESANPQPTFSVSSGGDDISATVVQGQYLTYTIPNTITADQAYNVTITATNTAGSSDKVVSIQGLAIRIPLILPIPQQSTHLNTPWTLNLNDYVQAEPTATIDFIMGFTPPDGMTLVDGVLNYTRTLPGENTSITILLAATNTEGTTPFSVQLAITTDTLPVWQPIPSLVVLSGHGASINLNLYVTGHPAPSIQFKPGSEVPIQGISITNGVISLAEAPDVQSNQFYTVNITATNEAGSVDTTMTVSIQSRMHADNLETFDRIDFNAIRSLLGNSVDIFDVSDNLIQSPIYLTTSIMWVQSLVPPDDTNSRTGLNLMRKRQAAIFHCASRLCGHIPELVSESVGGNEMEYGKVTWLERQQDLYGKANRLVQSILRDEGKLPKFNLFKLTGT